MILEEYQAPDRQLRNRNKAKHLSLQRSKHLLALSAKTEQSLEKLRERYLTYLKENRAVSLLDLSYSTNSRRLDYASYRISATGTDANELLDQLQKAAVVKQKGPNMGQRLTTFVFPGQGSVYKGMGAELLSTAPIFLNAVNECDSILARNNFPPITPFLSNSPDFLLDENSEEGVIVAQCACFVVEYALARLWMAWGKRNLKSNPLCTISLQTSTDVLFLGIKPDIVMGHRQVTMSTLPTYHKV